MELTLTQTLFLNPNQFTCNPIVNLSFSTFIALISSNVSFSEMFANVSIYRAYVLSHFAEDSRYNAKVSRDWPNVLLFR